jgi:Zn-dependent protease
MSLELLYFVGLVVAVILHEVAHGVVALWFGDDTARRAGRLTLNPVPHIDPFGSILLPALGAIAQIPVLAFAKPVPVDPSRLRNPRRDMLTVSLAGPAMNLLLMLAAAVVARALASDVGPVVRILDLPLAVQIALVFAVVNLFLGLFNLLPIPPLDGSALLERVLPRAWLPAWHRFRPYGIVVLFLAVFSLGFPGEAFDPFLRSLYRFILRA